MVWSEDAAKVVKKPWGCERWLVHELPHYAAKILEVTAGKRLSLQLHEHKVETSYVLSGTATLELENPVTHVLESHVLTPGMFYTVHPPQKHRLTAITDLRIYEVSTPHLQDVVRLEDDAGRPSGHVPDEHR